MSDERSHRDPVLPSPGKSLLKFGAKTAVAVLLLAFLFNQFDFSEVWLAMVHSEIALLVLGYATMIVISLLNAKQLHIALASQPLDFEFLEVWRIQLVSFFYGIVMPTELAAAVVKWYRLSRRGAFAAEAAAVVTYLRLLSTIIVLILGTLALMWDDRFDSAAMQASAALLCAASLLSLLPFSSRSVAHAISRSVRSATAPLPIPALLRRASSSLWNAVTEMSSLSRRDLAAILALGLLPHVVGVFVFYCLARAVAIELDVMTLVWLRAALHVILLVPVSVAGLGVREGTLVAILPGFYGVSPELALAFSFLLLGRRLLLALMGGLVEAYESFIGPDAA